MTIERDRWYEIDSDEGGRQTVYVDNILQAFSEYDAEEAVGEVDQAFVRLTSEVDGYGPMPPFWTQPLNKFVENNPTPVDAPEGGRAE